MSLPTILQRIIARKHEEIAEAKRHTSLAELRDRQQAQSPIRGFVHSLQAKVAAGQSAVIAEIKKASPSKGIIRADFQPEQLAQSYQTHGAACLSVLTDRDFFQGSEADFVAARHACRLPMIRKDFIVHAWQLEEARAMGADAILLIAAALDARLLRDLNQQANEMGMDVLVEVHNAVELESAQRLANPIVGINNRDLHSFDVSLQTTLDLLPSLDKNTLVVTESGIATPEDVALMRAHDVHCFLVGESFMRHPEPGVKLAELFA